MVEGSLKDYSSWTNVGTNDFYDQAPVTCFQIDKTQIKVKKIDRVAIPFKGGLGTTGYCCIQFVIGGGLGTGIAGTYYSENKQTQPSEGESISYFDFDSIIIPDDCASVRFMFVATKSKVPNGPYGTDCLTFRCRPLKQGGSNGSLSFNQNTNTCAYNNKTLQQWTCAVFLYEKTIKRTGVTYRQYDWTPDDNNVITLSTTSNFKGYFAPTNGWIISLPSNSCSSSTSNVKVNNIIVASSTSTAQSPLQLLVRKGDYIESSVPYTFTFMPCKSEEQDYRLGIINT
jgi:hypothetical protein